MGRLPILEREEAAAKVDQKGNDSFRRGPHAVSYRARLKTGTTTGARATTAATWHRLPTFAYERGRWPDETFYMSNISPQARQFNQGIWRELEEVDPRLGKTV